MRVLEYLSPTAIATFYSDLELFYINYLSEEKSPRSPQTLPMSIGSALDAYAKSYMHEVIFGKGADPRFDLQTLFEEQVEPQNRDWAWVHGKHVFDVYKNSGALADLILELQNGIGEPKFEIEIKGVVSTQRHVNGVVFLGKPDVFFRNQEGHSVILDFKVNGYCGKRPHTPMPGYVRCRGHMVSGPHKDAKLVKHKGMRINEAHNLNDLDDKWAAQLAIYGWLSGEEVGADFVTAIDQFSCSPSGGEFPNIRIAEHRLRVSSDFQWVTYGRAQRIMEIVNSGYIFRSLTLEQSQEKCALLDKRSILRKDMAETDDPNLLCVKELLERRY